MIKLKIALSAALFGLTSLAGNAADMTREQRMDEAYQNYRSGSTATSDQRSGASRDAARPGYRTARDGNVGPVERAERATVRGTKRVGNAMERGVRRAGNAISRGADKASGTLRRTGERMGGSSAAAEQANPAKP